MANFMLMEPANQSFGELLTNGVRFIVPRFQRDYAWEQEYLEDLWTDVEALEQEEYHYMGYIVLQRKDQPNQFEVIDGQQRLVTLSLVVLAAMRKLQDLIENGVDTDNNRDRLNEITGRFIGSKDLVSLKTTSKITLNRNNGALYKEICSKLEAPNHRGLTSTNILLRNAFRFFLQQDMGSTGEEIAQFINTFTSRLIFTKIVVQDSLNAYKVFETLNARGVKLSTPDLLKNYIFSVIAQRDAITDEGLDELDESWGTIVSQLGENNFTDFIRYHHNSRNRLVTKNELYKSVRRTYQDTDSAYRYLDSLAKFAPIYASLLNPFDEWWAHQDGDYREAKRYLEALSLFGIRQPLMILMIAFVKFSADEFLRTLRYIYVLSIRYNVVCHYSPKEQEKAYNNIARKIFSGELTRASHVKNSADFRTLYPSDDAFISVFEHYKMPSRRSSKKIRFLLAEIENGDGATRANDYMDTTLEHVCPYNPDQNWHQSFGEGISEISDRLGNMVLLDSDNLGRDDFESKKQVYRDSRFRLAKKVAEYEGWDLLTVNHFQTWMAGQAAQIWRVDYS